MKFHMTNDHTKFFFSKSKDYSFIIWGLVVSGINIMKIMLIDNYMREKNMDNPNFD